MTTSRVAIGVLALALGACTPAVTAPVASAPPAGGTAAPQTDPAAPSSRPSPDAGESPTAAQGAEPSPSAGPVMVTIRTKDSPLGACGAVGTQPFSLHGDPAGNEDGEQVWLEPDFGGGQLAAIFPYGHSASFEPQLVLRDGDGVAVAREGDTLELSGAGDPMAMCGIASVNGEPTPRASFGLPPGGTGTAIIRTCDDVGGGIGPFRIEFLARDRPQSDPLRYFEIQGHDEQCGAQTYELPAGRWDFKVTPGDRTIHRGKGGRFELAPATSVERALVFHRLFPGDGVGEMLLVVCAYLEVRIPYALIFTPLEGQAPGPRITQVPPGCRPVAHDLASGRWHIEASSPGYESQGRDFSITKDEVARASFELIPCELAGCPRAEPSPP